jgi:hypothetical protein
MRLLLPPCAVHPHGSFTITVDALASAGQAKSCDL